MWKKIKKFFKPWPKDVRITVRDMDGHMIGFKCVQIYNWNEIIPMGETFCQHIMKMNDYDEVIWNYQEV